jgi:hypothetical protein
MTDDARRALGAQDPAAPPTANDGDGAVELDDAALESASGGNFFQDAWKWIESQKDAKWVG